MDDQHHPSLSAKHYSRLRWFEQISDWSMGGWRLETEVDETLAHHRLLEPGRKGGVWHISDIGRHVLDERKSAQAAKRNIHHDLADRAAVWLRKSGRLAWTNVVISGYTRDATPEVEHLEIKLAHDPQNPIRKLEARLTCRPDVISVIPERKPNCSEPWILEAKVRRLDFLNDVKQPHKRLAYTLLAERFFYLAPVGLIDPAEVPPGCGLIIETRTNEFEVVLNSRLRKLRHTAHITRLLNPKKRKLRTGRVRSRMQ